VIWRRRTPRFSDFVDRLEAALREARELFAAMAYKLTLAETEALLRKSKAAAV
jgi:hypothetical protein